MPRLHKVWKYTYKYTWVIQTQKGTVQLNDFLWKKSNQLCPELIFIFCEWSLTSCSDSQDSMSPFPSGKRGSVEPSSPPCSSSPKRSAPSISGRSSVADIWSNTAAHRQQQLFNLSTKALMFIEYQYYVNIIQAWCQARLHLGWWDFVGQLKCHISYDDLLIYRLINRSFSKNPSVLKTSMWL